MKRTSTLRSPRDFCRVMRSGRRLRAPFGTVFVSPGEGPEARLGLAVPARVGGAVVRNRIKRRLRAAARSAELPAMDLVVRANPKAATLEFQELEEVFKRLERL